MIGLFEKPLYVNFEKTFADIQEMDKPVAQGA